MESLILDNLQVAKLRDEWNSVLWSNWAKEFRHSSTLNDFYANQEFYFLIHCYQSKERKHHNLNHLEFLFDIPKSGVREDRDLIIETMFFFFHDCVYEINPLAPVTNNEHKSALEARPRMERMGFGKDYSLIEEVCEVIELSNHSTTTNNRLYQWLLDCDLAILATETYEYQEYIKNIRTEYGAVTEQVWKSKRTEFLEYMLAKKQIFQHPVNSNNEGKARKNLSEELISIALTR